MIIMENTNSKKLIIFIIIFMILFALSIINKKNNYMDSYSTNSTIYI